MRQMGYSSKAGTDVFVFRKLPQLSPSPAQVTFKYYLLATQAVEPGRHTVIVEIHSEMAHREPSVAPGTQQERDRWGQFLTPSFRCFL